MEMREAEARGDQVEFYRLTRELKRPGRDAHGDQEPRAAGAEVHPELGLKTDLADAKYGPGWMDREGWV